MNHSTLKTTKLGGSVCFGGIPPKNSTQGHDNPRKKTEITHPARSLEDCLFPLSESKLFLRTSLNDSKEIVI